MCGIVGIVNKDLDKPCDKLRLLEMRDLLVHRGPDDEGIFIEGNAGLGHRRLSIIDLSTGHQPMSNEDGSLWIVYNGEIYNFKVLRDDLIKRGHIFKTRTDTEVVLHLYEERGIDCVKDLNGMFAFAIWDKRTKKLFLARDRMGVKPLYYANTKEAFSFSSEIKGLFKSGIVQAECDNEAIFEYFIFRYVAGERTLFKDVYSLLPGHILILKNGSITVKQYWSAFPTEINKQISLREATEKFGWLIKDSVKIRLMSDVPLGTFCSGGIDSSLVTAIAAKMLDHPINTFSVGFYEDGYDETIYARLVSKQYGTIHHEIRVGNKEFADLLPRMIWLNDEPLNYANSIQIYAVSKLAKEFVTVVLTGEGADELLGGYPRYFIPGLVSTYSRFPRLVQDLVNAGSSFINDRRIAKVRSYLNSTRSDALLYNSSFLQTGLVQDIMNNHHFPIFQYRSRCISEGKSLALGDLTNLLLLDQHTYLVSILHRQDKMSMGASIESRVPFLDYRIVEFCNSLPPKFKLNLWRNKYLVKKAARPLLPRTIVNRKKSGFGVPIGDWLRDKTGLGRYIDLLKDPKSSVSNFLIHSKIVHIADEHNMGSKNHEDLLWSLINFEIWQRVFLQKNPFI